MPSSSVSATSKIRQQLQYLRDRDLLISSRVEIIVCDLGRIRMAWFLNFYECAGCKWRWTDQWSCMCDDDCPHCGARYMSPYQSEELTTLIEEEGNGFVVFWSPETAEHDPEYRKLGRFPSREKALEFLFRGRLTLLQLA
jgi:hypothetical protein